VSNGEGVTVRSQAAAPTTPGALRDASAVPLDSTTPVVDRALISATGGVIQRPMSPTATDGGTTSDGQAQLAIAEIDADASGDDNDNLNDENVVFENTGDTALDLSGWTVSDEAGATYTVPEGTTLAPGAQVTLHTGSGDDTTTDLYWGSGRAVWNNGGDTVTVRDDTGAVRLEERY